VPLKIPLYSNAMYRMIQADALHLPASSLLAGLLLRP
jgi:hypothetical protein